MYKSVQERQSVYTKLDDSINRMVHAEDKLYIDFYKMLKKATQWWSNAISIPVTENLDSTLGEIEMAYHQIKKNQGKE